MCVALAQTVLVSCESCHVARIGVPSSSGLGLKKWVMICFSLSSNRVASGVKSTRRSRRLRAGRRSSGCRRRDPRGTPCSPLAPNACRARVAG